MQIQVEIIIMVLISIISALGGLAMKLIWDWKKKIETNQEALQAEQDAIKKNYIRRFEEIKERIDQTRAEILKEVKAIVGESHEQIMEVLRSHTEKFDKQEEAIRDFYKTYELKKRK